MLTQIEAHQHLGHDVVGCMHDHLYPIPHGLQGARHRPHLPKLDPTIRRLDRHGGVHDPMPDQRLHRLLPI